MMGELMFENNERFFFIALSKDNLLMGKCFMFRLKIQDRESWKIEKLEKERPGRQAILCNCKFDFI